MGEGTIGRLFELEICRKLASEDRSNGMVPLPKRKLSKGRRDRRRAHDALQNANLVQCSQCGEMRLPHTVCPNCGYYQGREIISMEKAEKKK
jgi:large subunit ribosomal protein L32